ncbi:MBL fold metallo-hydrolase [Bdellovibrionota bacterium FG-1]
MKPKPARPEICVIGTGEALSSGLGNASYLLHGKGIPTLLFDCGYQIPERLWRLDLHKEIDTICLTHLHADHVFGIVPLICRYWEERREKPLQIVAGRGGERHIRKLIELGYPGLLARLSFPLEFVEISDTAGVQLESLRVTAAKTTHSVLNYTLRVDFTGKGIRSFAVSGDGQITDATCALVSDVGFLLQEIYTVKTDIPVHADLKRLEEWAPTTAIQMIGVTHHARNEVSAVHRRIRALNRKDPRWFSLEPGMIIQLGGKGGVKENT